MKQLHTGLVMRVLSIAILLAVLVASVSSAGTQVNAAQSKPNPSSKGGLQEATFTLDNVTVAVRTPFLPMWVSSNKPFITSEPGAINQIATASSPRPYRSLSIIAIPFGTHPSIEDVPIAKSGDVTTYFDALRAGRKPYESEFEQNGPTAMLFGQSVTSQVSLLRLPLNSADGSNKPTLYVEWVAEAGSRLWIVRVEQEQPAGAISIKATASLLESLTELVLTSTNLDQPSTLTNKAGGSSPQTSPTGKYNASQPSNLGDKRNPPPLPVTPAIPLNAATPTAPGMSAGAKTPDTLFFPPWWSGNCNYDNYPPAPDGRHAFALGGSYLHMDACGPRPLDYAPPYDVYVNFLQGGLPQPQPWGAYQWECVEYVLRYMRLRFNINLYPANGWEVVSNYATYKSNYNPDGPDLEVVTNGGQPPAPQPGDILSYGGPPHGHTSLVKSVSVDSTGNGSITVAEQNNSANGISTLPVQNWYVVGNAGNVTRWLVGDRHYQPAAVRNQDGRLEVFVRGRDNALYHSWQTCPGCGWSGWFSEGGGIIGNPAVVRHQNGVLEVYARGTTGDIYRKWQGCAGCGFGDWVYWPAPVKFQGSPVAIINGVGGAHIFGWGADNQIWYSWQQCTSCAWSPWTSLGGLSTSNVAVGLDASNRVVLFMRGIDRTPYYRQQLAANSGSWTDWTSLGGLVDGNIAVGRNSDGRLEVFVLGTDTSGAMYHNWQTTPNGSWSGWYSLGSGQWARGPVVGQDANGSLEVYAVQGGSDLNYSNGLYRISQLDGWGGWSYLGGAWRVGIPSVTQNADGRLELFGRGDDLQLYNMWQNSANSLSWACCGNLGGQWP